MRDLAWGLETIYPSGRVYLWPKSENDAVEFPALSEIDKSRPQSEPPELNIAPWDGSLTMALSLTFPATDLNGGRLLLFEKEIMNEFSDRPTCKIERKYGN